MYVYMRLPVDSRFNNYRSAFWCAVYVRRYNGQIHIFTMEWWEALRLQRLGGGEYSSSMKGKEKQFISKKPDVDLRDENIFWTRIGPEQSVGSWCLTLIVSQDEMEEEDCIIVDEIITCR